MTDGADHEHEYSDDVIALLELRWGDGFLSPGGAAEVARLLEGAEIAGCEVLDIGCGTGGFIGQIRQALPAVAVLGVDLSRAYLARARARLGDSRKAWLALAAGEALPLADQSIDAAVAVFVFHELPGEVRRAVAAEAARVLRPGGVFVLVDSLQLGDRPGWDGLLDGFERSFHEPYYRHYLGDDLKSCFAEAHLALTGSWTAYLSKVMVFAKAA